MTCLLLTVGEECFTSVLYSGNYRLVILLQGYQIGT